MTDHDLHTLSALLTPDYLARLNAEQKQAVETTEGPLLILAGAGTGKTRVLTTRFAHILLQNLAWPEQILAVTFTNKAAREMKERISAILGHSVEGLWLGTFHALCARMLRRHAGLTGLEPNFTIIDTDDQIRLLKQIMAGYNLDLKRTPPAQLLNQIQNWKDKALLPQDITAAHESALEDKRTISVYEAYQKRLLELNACDFGDLMLHMVTIFRHHPDVLAQYHKRFRYILVDEYQDTNTIQYLWLRLLAKREGNQSANIACVGDDDQSIYSWRGADIGNILRFEKDFPGATIIRLERNYRSTPRILAAAAGIIRHNEERLGKTLQAADTEEPGDYIEVLSLPDSDEEARTIAQRAQKLHQEGETYAEMAVLVRAGFQTRPIEEALLRANIPYQVIGGLRFYERAEIRDAIAYLRAVQQPQDDLAFERIINLPKRGFGTVALNKLRSEAAGQGRSLQETLKTLLTEKKLKGKAADSLIDLLDTFDHVRVTMDKEGHVVAAEQLLERSGYLQMWRDDRSVEAPGRLDNLHELIRALADFPTLEAFLEHIALVMEADSVDQNKDRVSLMTLHAAKGLEFDIVFLPGWEEGLFPSQRSLDEGGNTALEEERRLAYVGLTRARKKAIIAHAASRRIYATWQDSIPSRFIDELPEDLVKRIAPARRSSSFGKNSWQRDTFGQRPALGKTASPAPPSRFAIGTPVKHPRFGNGVVLEADGDSLLINFENHGAKNILADFVEFLK
ncbi:UvrD-helicase domain-containing protein [Acetobacteraceae bacterium ESL0709]|nr:UvrD-helicase domain-containing protein [Acetobacteraceae bacterium ESL0697]MDF7678019.1 UvrD-helicase domain-containing protein [Acetobacteraceae bacterium ESL0709]